MLVPMKAALQQEKRNKIRVHTTKRRRGIIGKINVEIGERKKRCNDVFFWKGKPAEDDVYERKCEQSRRYRRLFLPGNHTFRL